MTEFVLKHPELVVYALTTLLSLLAHAAGPRAPRVAAVLGAVALDVPKLVQAMAKPKADTPKAEETKPDEPKS